LESEEVLYQSKKERKALRQAAADEATVRSPEPNATAPDLAKVRVESIDGVKFY
jgi:hypothetical protein